MMKITNQFDCFTSLLLLLFCLITLFVNDVSAFPNQLSREKTEDFNTNNKITDKEIGTDLKVEACDATNSQNYYIYCSGKLIEAVNRLNMYSDSKTFVDKPMKTSPEIVAQAFQKNFPEKIQDIDPLKLKGFLEKYFDKEGTELEGCDLDEWHEEPSQLKRIKDDTLRKWAFHLNFVWKKLCRKMKNDVYLHQDRYSLLYVPKQFIVPGGRFREFYYWDAYWIVKGLIASGLLDTTKQMLINFAYTVENHGFIPNGGRVYYLQRSHPPLFIPMVYEYFESTRNVSFVQEILPTLEKEITFWDSYRTLNVSFKGSSYTAYQYRAGSNVPRPESYREDFLLTQQFTKISDKRRIFRDLASAAESGWDFSSRWFTDSLRLDTIQTTNIVPVDLNSFMCWNFKLLSHLYAVTGNEQRALHYEERYRSFLRVFKKIFYVKNESGWYDYDIKKKRHNFEFYASVATPLFTGCYDDLDLDQSEAIFDKMEKMGVFDFAGGIPTSLNNGTKEQWDYPNGWSPLNHMLIEGLRHSKNGRMQQKAFWLAEKWVLNNYRVFSTTKAMWEKYNVISTIPDKGDGGEYDVQEGFGWTNGAVLDLLQTYSDRLQFDGVAEASETEPTNEITRNNVEETNEEDENKFNNYILHDFVELNNDDNSGKTSSANNLLRQNDNVLQRIMLVVNMGILLTGLVVIG